MGHTRNNLNEENEAALDRFHYHEAQDRAYMIGNMLSEYLLEHPVIMKHPELLERVQTATDSIGDVYQMITGLDMEAFPDQTDDSVKE